MKSVHRAEERSTQMWRRWRRCWHVKQDLLAQDGLEAGCGVGDDDRVEVALRGS
jgi:hypothetical protein